MTISFGVTRQGGEDPKQYFALTFHGMIMGAFRN